MSCAPRIGAFEAPVSHPVFAKIIWADCDDAVSPLGTPNVTLTVADLLP
jgi:hypothetical protein